MGIGWLTAMYGMCLLLCLISTGVTTTFGFVARFEKLPLFHGISSSTARSAIVAAFIIALSMGISLAGLTNIIKYGYGSVSYTHLDVYKRQHKELARSGVTLALLWNEYCAACQESGDIPYMLSLIHI